MRQRRTPAALAAPRILWAVFALSILSLPGLLDSRALLGQEPSPTSVPPGYEEVLALMSDKGRERREASEAIVEGGDTALVPGIVDTLFFTPRRYRVDVFKTLEKLTGTELPRRYAEWVEHVGAHPQIQPRPGYDRYKLLLLSRIDPRFAHIFYEGAPSRIRLEEIVWGGVALDGIPSLDNPEVIPAAEAGYLTDREKVFGVSLGGEQRAYPLRILSWHEMSNDVVGGEPVTLSYCTLCGSGILYSTRTPAGGAYTFGTSGLLYRSNKLMFDRQSYTLWSNLTGKPVVGRLARSSAELPILPMTLTTWGDWRRRHPDTTVVALPREMARRWGFDYIPGAADRARRGVSFPVWQKSERLDRDEEVYALRLGDEAKAYPLDAVLEAGLVHDRLAGVDLILLADPDSGAVRAYRRDGRRFAREPGQDRLTDGEGHLWQWTEEALVPVDGAQGEPLPRVPGHVALWFGWFGFYPDTEVFEGETSEGEASEKGAREENGTGD